MVRRKAESKRLSEVVEDKSQHENSNQNTSRRKKSRKLNVRLLGKHCSMTYQMYKSIRLLQNSTNFLIAKAPFARLIKEILYEYSVHGELRIQLKALQALQESSEDYLVQFFEEAYLCAMHAKRKTLQVQDMQLVRRLRGRGDVINH